MVKLIHSILKFRWIIVAVVLVLLVISIVLIPKVNVNYDLVDYLPDETVTKSSIPIYESEFQSHGSVRLMVESESIEQAFFIKHSLLEVGEIHAIPWIDDYVDLANLDLLSSEQIPQEMIGLFFKDGYAHFNIEFTNSDYDLQTGVALNQIREKLDGLEYYLAGNARDADEVRNIVQDELVKILLVIVPLAFIILTLASKSYFEPVIYLIVIGVAILFNMGTNFLFPNVSFITHAMASILQLAISLDYSLFVFHRYIQEREMGNSITDSIKTAMLRSFRSVFASALTTISGFMALVLMSYRIGGDMGFVLAKGILFSLISVVFVLPILLYFFSGVIEKARHKPFIPSFSKLAKFTIRLRYVFVVVGVILLVVSFVAQRNNSFIYSDTSGRGQQTPSDLDRVKITEVFGVQNPVIIMLSNQFAQNASPLSDVIAQEELVENVQLGASENYVTLTAFLGSDKESELMFDTVSFMREKSQEFAPDNWYMIGKPSAVFDIKESVTNDYNKVMLISIAAVFLIVVLTFKNVVLPVIIVSVIQCSIWMNMAIPYFQGSSLIFIGYMIIGALQLGATIDYAILLSSRYMEARKTNLPKEAAASALSGTGLAISVSALILTVAGVTEYFLSDIPSIKEIGILLGRGGAFSGLMVIFVLPALLVLFDKFIHFKVKGKRNVKEH